MEQEEIEKVVSRPSPVDRVVRMANEYYNGAGMDWAGFRSTGGHLHVVLDDGNLEVNHINFCISDAMKAGDMFGVALGFALLGLSVDERKAVYSRYKEYALNEKPE